jgi:hypothetical protein
MDFITPNFIKNYFLEKLLNARLHLMRENKEITNFIEGIRVVKRILIILPRDRANEIIARKYLSGLRKIFKATQISTLDIINFREDDVNWLGLPNNFYISKFRDQQFDLLIDLNSYHEPLCSFLGAKIAPPLRIHFSRGKFDKIYNMQIITDSRESIDVRYKNFFDYLSRIRNPVKMATIE